MKIYLASGWFSDEQMKTCVEAEQFLSTINDDNFFPRLMNLGSDGADWDSIFNENIKHLEECDIVVVNTTGKDMGTIWEAGYAYARGKQVIYFTPNISKPNLMLGKSGTIARTIFEIQACILNPSSCFAPKDFE